jgi:hypothetical protein
MRHFANTPLIKDARAALAAQPRISQAEIQTLLTYAHF